MQVKFRHGNDGANEEVSLMSGLECEDESLAVQSAKEECDINTIVHRFGLTGELPAEVSVPRSGDFTEITDYKSAMDAIKKADSGFMELPPQLRSKFDNDPQKLLEFMEDGRNYDEAVRLGLVNKPVEVPREPGVGGTPVAPSGVSPVAPS